MTELEWLEGTDFRAMLEHVRGAASDRKRRLLECAWNRRDWYVDHHEKFRGAVEVMERAADGNATPSEIYLAAETLSHLLPPTWSEEVEAGYLRDLRCLFGNPFRPVRVRPEWLAWNGETVLRVAQAIYDGRAWQDMPLLADALEEAGCDALDALDHCRQSASHTRGCWVLDALLGRM